MDKKNDILQTYRNRKHEFRLPLRDGAWEKLEKELAGLPVAAPPVVAVRRMAYRWLAIAAAVLLCVALSIPLLLREDIPVVRVSDTQPPVLLQKNATAREADLLPDVAAQSVPTGGKVAPIVAQSVVVAELPTTADVLRPVEPAPAVEEKQKDTDAATPKNRQIGPEPESGRQLPPDVLAAEGKQRQRKQAGEWSFGVQAGSGKTASGLGLSRDLVFEGSPGGSESPGPGQPENPDPDDPDSPDAVDPSPSAPLLAAPTKAASMLRMEPPLSYSHRMPVTVGLSVRKSLTDKFALETGLSYTYLYSDLFLSGLSYAQGSQRIHYLGIPLKANWTFYRKGVFSMYLSGGLLAEYAISARRNLMDTYQRLDMNPWQFSLNGSVGAELRLIRPVSLYLEPGIGYYFDNNSTIPTIRTERPWLFGFQLGLRFSY